MNQLEIGFDKTAKERQATPWDCLSKIDNGIVEEQEFFGSGGSYVDRSNAEVEPCTSYHGSSSTVGRHRCIPLTEKSQSVRRFNYTFCALNGDSCAATI